VTSLLTATRFALIEQARNRFAMLLAILFVPVWITMARLFIATDPVRFKLDATGQMLTVNGNKIFQITGALNTVTLIVGFMMFAATFKSGDFDRRLALAGYPRSHLLLAKVTTLVLASALVAAYATAIISVYWQPRTPWLLAAGLFGAAMTYGSLGVVLGTLLRREVEGMFAIVMISIIDVTLQNPVATPAADSNIIRFLPSYGAMQTSTAAGFSTTRPLSHLTVQLVWFACTALISLIAFHQRTRTAPMHTETLITTNG
jgi:hypothetical protein